MMKLNAVKPAEIIIRGFREWRRFRYRFAFKERHGGGEDFPKNFSNKMKMSRANVTLRFCIIYFSTGKIKHHFKMYLKSDAVIPSFRIKSVFLLETKLTHFNFRSSYPPSPPISTFPRLLNLCLIYTFKL